MTTATKTKTVTPDKVTIGEHDYVRADTIATPIPVDSPVRIVILQRGWVMVGHWGQDGTRCWLDQAAVIRRWGTPNEGLPGLVNGPKTATVLDKGAGHVEFHELAVVASIVVDADAWGKAL